MFPSHPVWSHPVFQHKAYEAFARELEPCLQEEEGSPNQLSILYQAMPLLADQLKALRAENKQTASEVKGLLDHLDKSQRAQSSQLQLLTSGGLTFRLEAPLAAAAAAAAAAAVWPQGRSTDPPRPPIEAAPLALSITGSSRYTSARASAAGSPSRIASPPPPPQPQLQLQPQLEPQSQLEPRSESPPTYCMSRAVNSVRALWREWTEGLGGNPSVAALDSKWGSRWRAGRQKEVQWYSLRLEVIKEIKRVVQAQKVSEEAAMWQVNLRQEQMGCSLDQLCKRLRAGRKALK